MEPESETRRRKPEESPAKETQTAAAAPPRAPGGSSSPLVLAAVAGLCLLAALCYGGSLLNTEAPPSPFVERCVDETKPCELSAKTVYDFPVLLQNTTASPQVTFDYLGYTLGDQEMALTVNRRFMTIAEYMRAPTVGASGSSDQLFVSGFENPELLQRLDGDLHIIQEILKHGPHLATIAERPIASVGKDGTGSLLHRHDRSWLWLLSGSKVWFFLPPDATVPEAMEKVDPCKWRSPERRPKGMLVVEQGPGQIGFVPDGWWHGTCNIGLAFGFGAQGDTSDWSEAAQAAQAGDLARLKEAVLRNPAGPSPLQLASGFGHLAAVEQLLERGAAKGKGEPPLHRAARSKHSNSAAIVERLLATRADLEAKHGGSAAFHLAVSKGHLDVARLLLEARSDVAAPGEGGRSALVLALARGGAAPALVLDAAPELLEKKDANGRLPLHHAAELGDAQAAGELLRRRCDTEGRDRRGNTALHIAAREGAAELLEPLLDAGAAVEAENKDGLRPAHYAAQSSAAASLIARLAKGGADVNAAAGNGWRPLHFAAMNGDARAVQALLKAGADAKLDDGKGNAPSMYAGAKGHDRLEALLMKLE